MLPFFSRICIMEYAVTLFPEPDSPTIPRILPLSRLKETPFTAITSPLSVRKEVFKSTTESIFSLILIPPQFRVKGIAKAVAQ